MSSSRLSIPLEGVEAVVRETSQYGMSCLETGGFFLAHSGESIISSIAMAGNTGVSRHHNFFQISASAIDRLFVYADAAGYWIPAQFHSHRFTADMSLVDEDHGFRAEDFISTILPHYNKPPNHPENWTWWKFSGGSWVTSQSAMLYNGCLECIVEFDEDGVRDR